jgi:hypothetical protein
MAAFSAFLCLQVYGVNVRVCGAALVHLFHRYLNWVFFRYFPGKYVK